MKTFYDFLTEQDAPKPGTPSPNYQPQQQAQPQQAQPQQAQRQPQTLSQQPSNKGVYDFYRNANDVVDNGVKAVTDFVNAHPQKNQWYEGAKLMNLYTRIKQDLKASEALLRPLLQASGSNK